MKTRAKIEYPKFIVLLDKIENFYYYLLWFVVFQEWITLSDVEMDLLYEKFRDFIF